METSNRNIGWNIRLFATKKSVTVYWSNKATLHKKNEVFHYGFLQ